MISPMLCRDRALPDGPGWVGEPKLDGYRALVRTGPQGVAITSRQGRSLTHRFSELAGLAEAPPALLDGELVVYGADGRPDFHALARRPKERAASLAVFDVLEVDGHWVGDRPYGQRRELLTRLDLPHGLTQVVTTGPVAAMWQTTADLALGGVVAKHVDSVYTPGQPLVGTGRTLAGQRAARPRTGVRRRRAPRPVPGRRRRGRAHRAGGTRRGAPRRPACRAACYLRGPRSRSAHALACRPGGGDGAPPRRPRPTPRCPLPQPHYPG